MSSWLHLFFHYGNLQQILLNNHLNNRNIQVNVHCACTCIAFSHSKHVLHMTCSTCLWHFRLRAQVLGPPLFIKLIQFCLVCSGNVFMHIIYIIWCCMISDAASFRHTHAKRALFILGNCFSLGSRPRDDAILIKTIYRNEIGWCVIVRYTRWCQIAVLKQTIQDRPHVCMPPWGSQIPIYKVVNLIINIT